MSAGVSVGVIVAMNVGVSVGSRISGCSCANVDVSVNGRVDGGVKLNHLWLCGSLGGALR